MTNFSIAGAQRASLHRSRPVAGLRHSAPAPSHEHMFCNSHCRLVRLFWLLGAKSGAKSRVPPSLCTVPSDPPRTIRTHVLAHLTPEGSPPRRAPRARPGPCRSAPRAAARRRPRARRCARVPPAPCAAAPLTRAAASGSGAGTSAALHHTAGPVGALWPRARRTSLTLGGRPAGHAPRRDSAGPGVPANGVRLRPAAAGAGRPRTAASPAAGRGSRSSKPAATYSPRPLRAKYHRR